MKITDLPFNQLIGIMVCDKNDGTVLALPKHVRYTNHLGTVHASALLALAEATSGHHLINELKDLGFEVLPVVRRVEAKFKKPAYGAIYSRLNVAADRTKDFISTLTTKGRALVEIDVDVIDENNAHALAATVEWFVARKD